MACFFNFVRQDSATVSFGKYPSENFTRCPRSTGWLFFTPAGGNTNYFWSYVGSRDCAAPFSWFSPQLQMLFSRVYADPYSAAALRTFCRSPEQSMLSPSFLPPSLLPCTGLSSLALCPVNSSYIGLPAFSPLPSQFRETTGIYLGSSSLTVSWKLSPGSKLGQ